MGGTRYAAAWCSAFTNYYWCTVYTVSEHHCPHSLCVACLCWHLSLHWNQLLCRSCILVPPQLVVYNPLLCGVCSYGLDTRRHVIHSCSYSLGYRYSSYNCAPFICLLIIKCVTAAPVFNLFCTTNSRDGLHFVAAPAVLRRGCPARKRWPLPPVRRMVEQ